jgi:hypothetical protein
MPIAKAMQLIKGGSTKWVYETFSEQRLFAWQAKYGAFSVSVSQVDRIISYIESQETHHRKMTFQEEFIALWRRHRIEYDERVSVGVTFMETFSRPFGTCAAVSQPRQ